MSIVLIFYIFALINIDLGIYLSTFQDTSFELVNKMWWGLLLGLFFVGLLAKMPRELVMSILGKGNSLSGILRATGAGVLLDLCSHGILVIGMQLYKRGATLGQVMAFLIASPWNSFSLTLILFALIGFKWTMLLLIFSMIIAIVSGLIFDKLVKNNILPKNPNTFQLPKNYIFFNEVKKEIKSIKFSISNIVNFARTSWSESTMVLRWIFFGVILTALIRTFLSPDNFETFFGPSFIGITMTLVVATILEVCSEGSAPIAADILIHAKAPGNAFAFLMTGVSTDYTEIISLKETTKSWKIALFLPLVTLPQVIIIALVMNQY